MAREYSIEKMLERGASAATMLTPGAERPDLDAGTEYGTRTEPLPSASMKEPEREAAAEEGQGERNQPERHEAAAHTPKDGNGSKPMEQDQKQAITKLASKYRIQAERLDRILVGVHSYEEAAKIIAELNKGDISRFLPA